MRPSAVTKTPVYFNPDSVRISARQGSLPDGNFLGALLAISVYSKYDLIENLFASRPVSLFSVKPTSLCTLHSALCSLLSLLLCFSAAKCLLICSGTLMLPLLFCAFWFASLLLSLYLIIPTATPHILPTSFRPLPISYHI